MYQSTDRKRLKNARLTVMIRVFEGGDGVERAGNEERSSSRSGLAECEGGVEVADIGGELGGAAIFSRCRP